MKTKTIVAASLIGSIASGVLAQTPSPSAQPTASVVAKTTVDSLTPAEIEETIRTLKSNFVDPNALKDQEINRATLEGLLTRLRGGATLLASKTTAAESPAPFYSEMLGNHIGYVRIGSLTNENLQALDKAMADFATKKVDAVVIDLRATSSSDFDIAAETTKRFVAKGKTLWTLRKTAAHQERAFTNDRDPVFQGILIALVDGESSGPAEAMAAALKAHAHGLLIGQPTAGRAVEYVDFPLSSGKILRIAVGEVIGLNGQSLFPGGVKPDLPVELSPAQKHQIFSLSMQRGLTTFVFERERPHFNEAALIAGTNPELELRQQRRNPDENLHDTVLQRAVDVITSLAVFKNINVETLEQRLGYQFRNQGLLREALTHPSVGHEKQRYHEDNQRLEFLGDAVLQLVITEYLYAHFPREQEGRLTKLRARLVSRDALKAHAQALELGRHLLMGRGEEASGGRARASTLADAFEAIVGAIYLDSDFAAAREFVLRETRTALERVREEPIDINPKGQLQEILQSIAMRGPTYEVLSATGPEHAKTFIVEARWEGVVLGRGTGLNKQAAEIEAANNALENKVWEK